MFCLKCGEAIPDGSEKCPLCGADLKSENSEQAVVYASQKEPPESSVVNGAENNLKKSFIGVMIAAICSFIFLSMNYMSVSIKLLYYGSSDTNYTGYYLTKCLGGTARLSGLMVILQERRCVHLIPAQLIEQYAQSVARWIQCEECITEFGFLAKHPTTGNAIPSPYVAMSQSFMKQANNLWYQIYQVVRENCATEYKGATPHDDVMEKLLTARRGG